ncbi:MAG: peptidoglycan DD-metalloendopeptidase family protein [Pisciglobus halotolerans]|nr:peptidoglycan DD-metalloendopeptidase family protein [Pisciglobus halotolerans]
MKSGLISTVKKMWSSITTRFSNSITNLVDKVKGMPQLMGKVLKKSGHFLKDAFVSIWKTAVKAIAKPANLIVGGANWILKRFGSDKEIPDWKPYAKGTDGHKGGHALVNDQKGSTYREAVQLPSGQTFMPKGRNVLLPNLPKGSKVLPAKETQRIYPYKSGIGKWASGIWDKTKAVGSKIKDTALNVWDYVSHPGKLVDKVISNFINYDGINGVALDMGKGLVKKTTGAMKDWAKNLIEEQTAGGGPIDFDGLVRTSKFGWRTHPISGKRKLHGGVDFGGGRGIGHPIKAQAGGKVTHAGRAGTFGNMVRLHQGMYDYIYAHLSKVLVRNGQNVAAGKLVGLMGSTGNSTGPHVHYEIRKNGKRIDPETASAGSVGGGAGRWRGTVMQALRMNGLPTTPAYANAWLRQIQSESGGNPRAVQGNIGDINNRTGDLAKGLVQVIGSTFRAYSFPGHKNRLNPLDSLLAGMNYAKSRYGVKGMLRKIGHGHGYANGGLVRNHQMAEIAEGNKPEMVIPLTKKARAVQLIQKAQDILGMSEEQRQSSQSNGQDIEMYRLMKEQNNLLKALLEKKADIYMDREKVGYATAPVIDRINGRNIQNAEGRVLT